MTIRERLRKMLSVFTCRKSNRALSEDLKRATGEFRAASSRVAEEAILSRQSADHIYETVRATLERMESRRDGNHPVPS